MTVLLCKGETISYTIFKGSQKFFNHLRGWLKKKNNNTAKCMYMTLCHPDGIFKSFASFTVF